MHDPQQRISGFPPRPDILWKLGKTAASIRFVNDAATYLANGWGTDAERRMLAAAIEAVKSGARRLERFLAVDAFLLAGSPPFWHVDKTGPSIRFVREAQRRMASCDPGSLERQMLGEAVEAVKAGERTLSHPLSVDDFLVGGFPEPWEAGKTEASKRFVREATAFARDASPSDAQMLGEAVEAVKAGERVLDAPIAVETFLTCGFP